MPLLLFSPTLRSPPSDGDGEDEEEGAAEAV